MDKQNEKRIRVLVNAPLAYGGITSMMLNIQRNLDLEHVNFDYLVFHDGTIPHEDDVKEMGSEIFVASADDIKCKLLKKIVRINKIRKICKKEGIKILHYNADSPFDLINVISAKLGGVKYVVLHSHNAGFGMAGKGIRFISFLLRPLIPLFCDSYISCSDFAARFLFPKSIIKHNKYHILFNGIELQKYKFDLTMRQIIRNELKISDKYVVGHVGRFSAQKNHDFLLEIFKKVYERDNTAILLLFGDGELMDAIKEKAQVLGIQSAIIFYGASNEMYKMYQAIDVFVMPSLHEGLPVTGIEAQASGLPCVFSDAITKEVDIVGDSEFISLDSSADVWAERILSHKGQLRESKLELLKNAGYDIQQTADRLTEIYFDMVENL